MEFEPCYLCKATRFDSLSLLGKPDQQIVRCRTCQLGRTWPVPDGEIEDEAVPEFSHGHDSAFRESMVLKTDQANLRHLEALTKGRKFFDMGCGDGRIGQLAQKRGWKVYGCDINKERTDRCRRLLGPGIIHGDILSAKLPDHPYDAIYARFVLEHQSDPVKALHALHNLCAPGGFLMIQVPNSSSAQARLFGKRWFQWMPNEHFFHFTPESLARLVKKSGFEVMEISTPFTPVDLIGISRSILSKKTDADKDGERIGILDILLFGLGILPAVFASFLGKGGTIRVLARPKKE